MVRFNDERFKNLTRAKKIELIDKYMKKADEKIADIEFFTDIVNNYKAKLNLEKSRS